MAIKYIGSNLVTKGGNGTFETDPSGWGLKAYPLSGFSTDRKIGTFNGDSYEGVHNALVVCEQPNQNLMQFRYIGYFYPEPDKNYEISAYVKCAGFAASTDIVYLRMHTDTVDIIETIGVPGDGSDWVKISAKFKANNQSSLATLSLITVRGANEPVGSESGATYNLFGFLYIDKLECYEYVLEGDGGSEPPPGPDPEPALGIQDVFYSKNPIVTDIAATANSALPNFQVINTIEVNASLDGSSYFPALTMGLEPDSGSLAQFYANAAFRGYLKASPPPATTTGIARLTDRITRFRYKFGELYNDLTEPETTIDRGDYLVLLGGISKEIYPGLDFFNTYLKSTKKFLTWQPEIKTIDRVQEEFLYFLLWDKDPLYAVPTELNLKVKVYYRDNTIVEAVTRTLNNPGLGWLLQVPAGFVNAGVQALDPVKPVIRYELWLENQSGAIISEVRTYKLVQDIHPYSRYFMFLNSLGGYDTVRTTGISSKSAKFSRQEVEKFLPANYSRQSRQFATSDVASQNEYDVSSGHVSKRYADYLQDMLISQDVYEIVRGRRVPVIIGNSNVTLDTKKVNRWFVRFDVKLGFKNNVYTPEL